MPFNASGQSFAPTETVPIFNPTLLEGTGYNGLTSAQCAALGLSSTDVTSAGELVEAAKVRTTGITIVVPTDQPQVTFGNQSPLAGTTSANPIVAIPAVTSLENNNFTTPSASGFAIAPGNSIFLSPYNDAMYAITPSGVTATIYYLDS